MLPALGEDFRFDWHDRRSLLDPSESDISLSSFVEPAVPRCPPPMSQDIRQAMEAFPYHMYKTNLDDWPSAYDMQLDGWSPSSASNATPSDEPSPTQSWYQSMKKGFAEGRLRAREAELEALEHRAQKYAAQTALKARRLQRREADVSAVEDRAKRTMAELAKQNLQAKRKEAELAQLEELALARQREVDESTRRALESQKLQQKQLLDREKQLGRKYIQTKKALRQQQIELIEMQQAAQKELEEQREQANFELAKRKEEADKVLMKKIKDLDKQREVNKQYLVQSLRDPGAYLEKTRAELKQREAEFAVEAAKRDAQIVAREQELADREEQLAKQQQADLAERTRLLRSCEEADTQLDNLNVVAEELEEQECANLIENVFTKWRGLVLDSQLYLKLSAIGIQEGQIRQMDVPSRSGQLQVTVKVKNPQVPKGVAWSVNPMDIAAKKEVEREQRQHHLVQSSQQELKKVLGTVFFIWRGVVLRLYHEQKQIRRAEQVSRYQEALPKGLAWEVRGMNRKKWSAEKVVKVMVARQDEKERLCLNTTFFRWKHLLKDPNQAVFRESRLLRDAQEELSKPVAWSVRMKNRPKAKKGKRSVSEPPMDTDAKESVRDEMQKENIDDDGPRLAGRGKPFNYPTKAARLQVVRLSIVEPNEPDDQASQNTSSHASPTGSKKDSITRSPNNGTSRSRRSNKESGDVQIVSTASNRPKDASQAWVVTF